MEGILMGDICNRLKKMKIKDKKSRPHMNQKYNNNFMSSKLSNRIFLNNSIEVSPPISLLRKIYFWIRKVR